MSSEWLKMDSILHKAHIEVDRQGTKAAATSIGVIEVGRALLNYKTVLLDRPFIFAIMHNSTALPVFTGILNSIN